MLRTLSIASLALILTCAPALAGDASVKDYQKLLHDQIRHLAEPMFSLLSKERSDKLRAVIPACRKQKVFKDCLAGGSDSDCELASRCVFLNKDEQKFIEPNQKILRERYDAIQKQFDATLKGHRRGFAIGTVNRLVERFNETTATVLSSFADGGSNMASDCNKNGDGSVNADVLRCMYDRLGELFSRGARQVDEKREELRKFVAGDLARRIDGFKDAPAK